ncbi:hypothetical protein HMPREF0239_00655 [Clostridium sp. ATCC BAA-442]|nr:hypothetical protein HMPREF0239_00655 [Clostridium sp. ATCC BAA-442]
MGAICGKKATGWSELRSLRGSLLKFVRSRSRATNADCRDLIE